MLFVVLFCRRLSHCSADVLFVVLFCRRVVCRIVLQTCCLSHCSADVLFVVLFCRRVVCRIVLQTCCLSHCSADVLFVVLFFCKHRHCSQYRSYALIALPGSNYLEPTSCFCPSFYASVSSFQSSFNIFVLFFKKNRPDVTIYWLIGRKTPSYVFFNNKQTKNVSSVPLS